MPFLRRRGQVASRASESDMRRHTSLRDPASAAVEPPPPPPKTADAARDEAAPASEAPSRTTVPAPPVTPPNDGPPSANGTMYTVDELPSRPESPPIQDETPKHRRFSMLRFRNASDSQLSA